MAKGGGCEPYPKVGYTLPPVVSVRPVEMRRLPLRDLGTGTARCSRWSSRGGVGPTQQPRMRAGLRVGGRTRALRTHGCTPSGDGEVAGDKPLMNRVLGLTRAPPTRPAGTGGV